MNDIIGGIFNKKFMDELFKPQELYSRKALRTVFERLVHASIMRLNAPSMDKVRPNLSVSPGELSWTRITLPAVQVEELGDSAPLCEWAVNFILVAKWCRNGEPGFLFVPLWFDAIPLAFLCSSMTS